MKKAIIAVGMVVMMILGVSYAFGYGPGERVRCGEKQGHDSRGYWKRLNLTEDQKAKFNELRRKFIGENAQLIGEITAKRLELRALWSDPKADSKTILAKEEEMKPLRSQIRDKIVQFKLEARNFLTPEQIEKLGVIRGMGFGFGRGFHHHG